jgi:hypothetical protein
MEHFFTDFSFQIFLSYIIGSCVGYILHAKLSANNINIFIEHLIDEGFLRSKIDNDGNTVILKYHDTRH